MNQLGVPERERTTGEIVQAQDLVEDILAHSERARNDDNWLIFKFLQRSGEDIQVEKVGEKFFIVHKVPFEDFGRQPSRETITRVRRRIQMSEGRYLPTDMDVFDRRVSRSQTFRKVFGVRT